MTGYNTVAFILIAAAIIIGIIGLRTENTEDRETLILAGAAASLLGATIALIGTFL